MPRILTRFWLLPLLLIAGQALALGLGDIRLSSALNEPLIAEIELLATAPEELTNLTVQLASAETFERYGLDRPLYLTELQFDIFKSGTTSGNLIRIRSAGPLREPFVTFLVEATWSRGRLLREYTVLLDPPTFAPPPVTRSTQALTAPRRSTQADSGRIDRSASQASTPPPPRQQAPVTAPVQTRAQQAPAQQRPAASVADEPGTVGPVQDFDTVSGGEIRVQRGDTLWGIASRNRPDSRLTVNQMMMALFEANPEAFSNNINVLRAGAILSIPSADNVYRISRGEALSAVQEQNEAWGGGALVTAIRTEPSLTLVPPDEDQTGYDASASASGDDFSREYEIEDRIIELEAEVPTQDSLIEIRNNELARLRAELARIRGEEPLELPSEDVAPDEDLLSADDEIVDEPDDESIADDQIFVDDGTSEDAGADVEILDPADEVVADTVVDEQPPAVAVVAPVKPQPTLLDTILELVLSIWGAIAAAIIAVLGILVWFARRAGREEEDDITGMWNSPADVALDADRDAGEEQEAHAATTQLQAMTPTDESSMIVVEQESKAAMAAEMAAVPETTAAQAETSADPLLDTGTNKSLEDTFSSDTAINLDQSDPIAEADFHMAYGLHDQAADLINGALEVEPEREDLLAKLCEVYFVWGNQDAFTDAAQKLKTAVGESENSEWDKIVIMGQQIAGDHELFAGQIARAATQAVDLSFEGGTEEIGVLDMDLAAGPDGEVNEIIDLGMAEDDNAGLADQSGIDFVFEEADTSASVTQDMASLESTEGGESTASPGDHSDSESTVETPTIEQQFDVTAEVKSLAEQDDSDATKLANLEDELPGTDATAEIDLDELGLNLDELVASGLDGGLEGDHAATLLANLEEDSEGDDAATLIARLDDDPESDDELTIETGSDSNLNLDEPLLDDLELTGENKAPNFDDLDATGENEAPIFDQIDDSLLEVTGRNLEVDLDDALEATGRNLGLDDDSLPPSGEALGIDTSLLDATGQTQILSEDFAVETASDVDALIPDEDDTLGTLSDDVETLLAPLDEDDELDFAKTEALPVDIFAADPSTDETGELPSLAGSTDLDLDLDDLTAALKISEVGDTVNQPFDDATVEHQRVEPSANVDIDGDGADDSEVTQAIAPGDLSEDLHDARTMTEVGTKLDLARAYVDMGDPAGARSILEEVLDEGDDSQRQQAQQLLDTLPS